MDFRAGCKTTAMGIMPHADIDKALALALSLDVPYWPQLPNVSYHEDMYAQASEHFPGMTTDAAGKRILFDSVRFGRDLAAYSERMADPGTFSLTAGYSVAYHRFLALDLSPYAAIRGQLIGPVSFGFKVTDEHNTPIIYNDDVRTLLADFIQRKINAQYLELRQKNPNAFVWLDEPGLGWVFSGLSGYDDVHAKRDYADFLSGLSGPRALHLCANVNLPYLLGLGTDILSFDAYQMELMPRAYAEPIARFLRGGGIISWGIVPNESSVLRRETPAHLAGILLDYWLVVSENSGIALDQIAAQALVAPARCCLKNIGLVGANDDAAHPPNPTPHRQDLTSEEAVVEAAFDHLRAVSSMLKQKFGF
jgi:hypothetical protein